MSATLSAPDPGQILRLILDGLRVTITIRGGRERAATPLVMLVWTYLNRLATRFERLADRLQAGIASPPKRPVRPPLKSLAPDPGPRKPRLPVGLGWLMRKMPETRQYGGPIRHLLSSPEMAVLLEASPQACRMLRQLCRMFAIEPGADFPAALFGPPAKPGLPTPDPRVTEQSGIKPAIAPPLGADPLLPGASGVSRLGVERSAAGPTANAPRDFKPPGWLPDWPAPA